MQSTVKATSRSKVSLISIDISRRRPFRTIPALTKQDVDEYLELADKLRRVGAVLVDSVEKFRFVARPWLACLRLNGLERNEVVEKARKYLRLFNVVRLFTITVLLHKARLALNVSPQPVDQNLVETIGCFQLSGSSQPLSKEVLFIDSAIELAQNPFTFVVLAAVAFGIWVERALTGSSSSSPRLRGDCSSWTLL
ncbi:hypothetical protein MMC28_006282 [Mycoblastus sanguinarius]|nr:hypothetical protein [Mycoblastus sanguinarius]